MAKKSFQNDTQTDNRRQLQFEKILKRPVLKCCDFFGAILLIQNQDHFTTIRNTNCYCIKVKIVIMEVLFNNSFVIYVTERSRSWLWDVRLREDYKMRSCFALSYFCCSVVSQNEKLGQEF